MNTINANETLNHCNQSNSFHTYLFGMMLTDSLMQAATRLECFWFLDVVATYQLQLYKQPFQTWILRKNADASASIIAKNSDGEILVKHKIKYTHFLTDELQVCVDGNVISLHSEYQ